MWLLSQLCRPATTAADDFQLVGNCLQALTLVTVISCILVA
jgi:hypothetical protein